MTTTLPESSEATELAGKCLAFRWGGETYGISVLKVREILRQPTATEVPHLPDGFKGVLNWHGKTIPVVDLRLKLGPGTGADTGCNRIVVLRVTRSDQTRFAVGFVMDGVEEMANPGAPPVGMLLADEALSGGKSRTHDP